MCVIYYYYGGIIISPYVCNRERKRERERERRVDSTHLKFRRGSLLLQMYLPTYLTLPYACEGGAVLLRGRLSTSRGPSRAGVEQLGSDILKMVFLCGLEMTGLFVVVERGT